jgi:hypothetical protein
MVDVERCSIGDGMRHLFDNFCDEGHVLNVLLSEDIPLPLLVSINCNSWTRSSANAKTMRGRLIVVVKHNRIKVLSVRVIYISCS